MGEVDIDTLTFEKYLALTQEEQGSKVVRPIIGADVHFEIKNLFIRELRKDPFSRNKIENAHEYIENVLCVCACENKNQMNIFFKL